MSSCSACAPSNGGSGHNTVWKGSLAAGASSTLVFEKKTLAISAIRTPNILIFSENPYLKVGDKFILENIAIANSAGLDGLVECQTVTAVAVAAAGKFEVATDAVLTSLTGSPTIDFAATAATQSRYGNCGASAADLKKLQAIVCDGTAVASNFTGYLYVDPPNTAPRGALGYINAGSNEVTIKGRTTVRVNRGDRIDLAGTAITGLNAAVVVNKIEGRNDNNEKVITLQLDKEVTGITIPAVAGVICTDVVISSIAICPISFTVTCGCAVTRTIPKAITSASTFPQGRPYEGGECGQTQYCYTIVNNTPGAETPYEMGTVIL